MFNHLFGKNAKPLYGSRKAFTLIELLVVIAIIAILAAILFPVFARARENARRATCQSNMRQVALGWTMYAQDYDETFPWFMIYRDGGTVNTLRWQSLVEPYVKSGAETNGNTSVNASSGKTGVFVCPNYDVTPPDRDASGAASNYATLKGVNAPLMSYSPNYWATTYTTAYDPSYGSWQDYKRLPVLASFSSPSLFVLLVENKDWGSGAFPGGGQNGFGWASIRHMEGSNYAFVDGHVKWYKGGSPFAVGNYQQVPGSGICYAHQIAVTAPGGCGDRPRMAPRGDVFVGL